MSNAEWTESGPMNVDAGDMGGDVQAGPAFERRFTCRVGDDTWRVFSVAYYAALDERTGRTWVEEQREYILCSDPEFPGDTELWGDYRYEEHADTASPEFYCKMFSPGKIDFDAVAPDTRTKDFVCWKPSSR